MKQYNVKDIAKKLNVNEETVRRWIRSGELKSTLSSKKEGNVVDEQQLFEFVQTKPKYRKMIGLEELPVKNTYSNNLTQLLNELIAERNKLNNFIDTIQSLLEES